MTTERGGGEVRRWQEDVARDPASPSFVPLADVYRREGRLDVARRLCQRGLQAHPEQVEGHVLLGRIFREQGEHERALDEFDIVLHLDPQHRAARRAIGYLCLERRDWAGAVRHLELSLASDSRDVRVASALALARRHLESGASPAPVSTEPPAALAESLRRFMRESRVRFAMLMEGSGRILLQYGFADDLNLADFASLGAGVQSASGALARMLGEPRFALLVQGQGERQVLIGTIPVGPGELVLIAVLGAEATIGLVRVRFQEMAREVSELGWRPAPAATFDAGLAEGLRRANAASRSPGF